MRVLRNEDAIVLNIDFQYDKKVDRLGIQKKSVGQRVPGSGMEKAQNAIV